MEVIEELKNLDEEIPYSASEVTIDLSESGYLGSGGYGSVRLGSLSEASVVAVKASRLTGDAHEIEECASRFANEVKMLRRIKHENIVKIFGWSQWHDNVAIIMEYMPGRSLHELLFSDNGLQLVPVIAFALKLQFCVDISNGVAHLHHAFSCEDKRIAHGDIKPANILLTARLDCKVADFGGARMATITGKSSGFRQADHGAQYTQGFAAPERDCETSLRKAMDVYSVGATFYAILLRQYPSFYRVDFERQIEECNCTSNTSHNDKKHFDFLKKLVSKCCKSSPGDRGDIKEVVEVLRDYLVDCDDCNKERVVNHVDDITKVYKVNIPSTGFEKPKLLSETTFNDFDKLHSTA